MIKALGDYIKLCSKRNNDNKITVTATSEGPEETYFTYLDVNVTEPPAENPAP